PPGTGALVLGPNITLADLAPLSEGATASDAPDVVQRWALPERYEAGTPNAPGIAALGAALEWLAAERLATVTARLQRSVERLRRGLETIAGVRLLSPADPEQRVPVVSCVVRGWRPIDFAQALERHYGVVTGAGVHGALEACRSVGVAPHGTVRFSPGWNTDDEEIDRVVVAVAELARSPSRAD
ncbi:MAG: aminotransferase class V-fold PLP-dependent enzyme, partial [Thermomicrobium sp.]|nr:aminotransferase class V-fold PLP-dependent enzyme [Thermomicrobium sp.]